MVVRGEDGSDAVQLLGYGDEGGLVLMELLSQGLRGGGEEGEREKEREGGGIRRTNTTSTSASLPFPPSFPFPPSLPPSLLPFPSLTSLPPSLPPFFPPSLPPSLTSFDAAILSPTPLLWRHLLVSACTASPASVAQELMTDMSISSCSHLTRA